MIIVVVFVVVGNVNGSQIGSDRLTSRSKRRSNDHDWCVCCQLNHHDPRPKVLVALLIVHLFIYAHTHSQSVLVGSD